MSVQQFVSYCYLFGYSVALSLSLSLKITLYDGVSLCFRAMMLEIGLTCVSMKADLEMSIFVKTKL